jgi:hypothetical protein
VILAAGLLVLLGLGLFVGGVLTGVTALFWACVGACAVAAVLLAVSRRQGATPRTPGAAPTTAQPVSNAPAATGPATADRPSTAATFATGGGPDPAPGPVDEPVGEQSAAGDAATGVHAATHRSPAWGRSPATGAHAVVGAGHADHGEPGIEEVEVTDLLMVVDLTDEVLVVDEHPRYHLEGCRFLGGREAIPLPLDEARADGFTPCARCTPDRHLADRERARKAGRGA